jgi:hypothetical protein
MSVLALLTVIVLVSLLVCLGHRSLAHRRKPAELRGDWWTRFERDFRAYAATATPPAPHKRRPARQPKSTEF